MKGKKRKAEPQKMKDPYADDIIFRLGLVVPPKSPYFLWRYRTPTMAGVYIPFHLHYLEIPNSLFLIDEKGGKWKMNIYTHGRRLRLGTSKTWGSLRDANHIKIGDVCIFEFVQGLDGLDMLVRVIRAPERMSSMKLEDQHSYDADIFRYGLATVPNNPYFVWRSTECQSAMYNMLIPTRFHHMIGNTSVILIDEKGKKWETKILKWNNRLLCSRGGWKRLCNANNIKLGDMCICEFVQGLNGLDILVRVIRVHTLTKMEGVERKEVEKIDKETTYESEFDESYGDNIGMQRDISSVKCKLESSPRAPLRRSARKVDALGRKQDIDEEDGIEQIEKCNFPRKSRRKSKDAQYRVVEDQDDIEEEYSIERINAHDFPQKPRWKSKDAQHRTIENQEDIEDECSIERIYECDLPCGWEQKIKDAQQIQIEDEDAHIDKFEGNKNYLISKDVSQKRGTPIGSSMKLEQLHSYFNLVHKERALTISLNNDVFGHEFKIYMFFKDINNFCLLEPISNICLIYYMCYLHEKMKEHNILDRFLFVNPNSISTMSKAEETVCALVNRFIDASTNQLVLAPCNIGNHWILTIIDPYSNNVVLLDPLSHRFRYEIWSDIVNEALSRFSASKGENKIKKPTRVAIKAPLQPDSKQCGFYIMRYMRDIVENYRGVGLTWLQSVFEKTSRVSRSSSYSKSEINEVQVEWAEFLLDYTDQRKRLARLRR